MQLYACGRILVACSSPPTVTLSLIWLMPKNGQANIPFLVYYYKLVLPCVTLKAWSLWYRKVLLIKYLHTSEIEDCNASERHLVVLFDLETSVSGKENWKCSVRAKYWDGEVETGGGAMVGALKATTNKEPVVVGKPSTFLMDYLASEYNLFLHSLHLVCPYLSSWLGVSSYTLW